MSDTPKEASKPPLHTTEMICESGHASTGWNQTLFRIRVDGGWLYIAQVNSRFGIALQQTFVPDASTEPTGLDGLDLQFLPDHA